MAAGIRHVLLVDDHDESLLVLAKLLRRCSYEVQTARTFAEAVEAARRRSFDLLISDVGLPDRSGLELMRELRELFPVKGIALSGFTEERDALASQAAGYSKHLNKPVIFADLLEAIEEAIGWHPGQGTEPHGARDPAAWH